MVEIASDDAATAMMMMSGSGRTCVRCNERATHVVTRLEFRTHPHAPAHVTWVRQPDPCVQRRTPGLNLNAPTADLVCEPMTSLVCESASLRASARRCRSVRGSHGAMVGGAPWRGNGGVPLGMGRGNLEGTCV